MRTRHYSSNCQICAVFLLGGKPHCVIYGLSGYAACSLSARTHATLRHRGWVTFPCRDVTARRRHLIGRRAGRKCVAGVSCAENKTRRKQRLVSAPAQHNPVPLPLLAPARLPAARTGRCSAARRSYCRCAAQRGRGVRCDSVVM